MKKSDRKYLYDISISKNILDFAEQHDFFKKEELSVKNFDNATILPAIFKGYFFALGGVLDEHNQYIDDSAVKSLFISAYNERSFFSRLNESYETEDVEFCDETVFYGGMFFCQWGHFLLEIVTRLYPIVENFEKYKNMKIVFLPTHDIDSIDGAFLEFLNLIGIKKEQIVLLRKPSKYKRVFMPEYATIPYSFWTKEYKNMIDFVILQAMSHKSKVKTYDKIYLSRKKWALSSDRDIGEDKVEKFFNKNGFVSVSLEQYSLVDQIHIIQNAKEIACVSSTVSHTLIFAKDGVRTTIINKMPLYNPLQFLVDDMKNLDVTYIDAYWGLFNAGYGFGPFLYGVTENLINYAKDNNMKKPDLKSNKEDFFKYFEYCFSKIEDISASDQKEFINLYKIMRDNCLFYSKKELVMKKYLHKFLGNISFGRTKEAHFLEYFRYKKRLKEYTSKMNKI